MWILGLKGLTHVFAHVLKIRHPGKFHFTFFFSKKVSTVIYSEGD